MAEGEGPVEPVGGTIERVVNLADHPLLLLLALTLGVFALGGLLYYLFVALGWSGPASIFR
jgi:hypothetical protein